MQFRIEGVDCVAAVGIGSDRKAEQGDLIIDGHHRAAKCLQTGVPFRAFLLTVAETDSILKKRPDAQFVKAAAKGPKNVAKKQRSAAQQRRRPADKKRDVRK